MRSELPGRLRGCGLDARAAELAQERPRARHGALRSGRSIAVRTAFCSVSKSVRAGLVEVPPRDEWRARRRRRCVRRRSGPSRSFLVVHRLSLSAPSTRGASRRATAPPSLSAPCRARSIASRRYIDGLGRALALVQATMRQARPGRSARSGPPGPARSSASRSTPSASVRSPARGERLAQLPAEDQDRAHRIVELAPEDLPARARSRPRRSASTLPALSPRAAERSAACSRSISATNAFCAW